MRDLGTDWNQAQAYQFRLHSILEALNSAKLGGDYDSWATNLYIFYTEMIPCMKEEEDQKAESLIEEAVQNLSLPQPYNAKKFKALLEAEKYMRRVMRERGLLLPRGNDPMNALREDTSY